MQQAQKPIIVINQRSSQETGNRALISTIQASKTVSDVVRTCLGPRAMLKMLLDPMGGITLTNDGNAILREIDVSHPAAKALIDMSRTQDDEVGDGTTSVVILAGEVLFSLSQFVSHQQQKESQLRQSYHPIALIAAVRKALEEAVSEVERCGRKIDTKDDNQVLQLLSATLGTKVTREWSSRLCQVALEAVRYTASSDLDVKRNVRIEKVPGGEISESQVFDGIVLVGKDVLHSGMRRRIEQPRILLLDAPLEYRKGESQTAMELTDGGSWKGALEAEEQQIREWCDRIVSLKPDVVVCEKGISDLAQHFLVRNGISAIRRLKKTDNQRLSRVSGAKIVSKIEEIKESDIGTRCGLFQVSKIGDEWFAHFIRCKSPGACTVMLRGPSKEVLSEVERNLQDAICVARNLLRFPRICPGGGSIEMAVANRLTAVANGTVDGIQRLPLLAVASAFEAIPRVLLQNCGADVIRSMTKLRSLYQEASPTSKQWAIDGKTGVLVEVDDLCVWEPAMVKIQTFRSALETVCMLLRVDDIASATTSKDKTPQEASIDNGDEVFDE